MGGAYSVLTDETDFERKDLRIRKICFIGDTGVGKTSIVRKYVYDSFKEGLIEPINEEYFVRI